MGGDWGAEDPTPRVFAPPPPGENLVATQGNADFSQPEENPRAYQQFLQAVELDNPAYYPNLSGNIKTPFKEPIENNMSGPGSDNKQNAGLGRRKSVQVQDYENAIRASFKKTLGADEPVPNHYYAAANGFWYQKRAGLKGDLAMRLTLHQSRIHAKVTESRNPNTIRKTPKEDGEPEIGPFELAQLVLKRACNGQRVSIRLASDVQEHGIHAVGRDNVELRRRAAPPNCTARSTPFWDR